MAIILTWKLWTMILMKRLRNWNKPWTKWDPRLSGCLSVGSTEREGRGRGDWQRWVIKGDNSMWPLLGVRLSFLALIETREVVIGQNSYYFTNHHFCVLYVRIQIQIYTWEDGTTKVELSFISNSFEFIAYDWHIWLYIIYFKDFYIQDEMSSLYCLWIWAVMVITI